MSQPPDFVKKKFWNTDTPILLHTIYGCYNHRVELAELGPYDGQNLKYLLKYLCGPVQKKFGDPIPIVLINYGLYHN